MSDQPSETTIAQGVFGTVTSKRVVYYGAKTWFRGGSREDIPLKHVTSVSLAVTRSVLLGLFLLIVGGVSLLAEPGAVKVVGVILLGLAVLLLWGSPSVKVNTAGQDKKAARGLPWHRGQATVFVEAVRSQLFHE
jgi:hypothetical protein